MKNGDIVRLTCDCLGNPKGTLGFVFDEYQDFDDPKYSGVSVIFKNGNLDGFSIKEQNLMLEYVSSTNFRYKFKNVIVVSNDFSKGIFNFAWEQK